PHTAAYTLGARVGVLPLVGLGINPRVAHVFVFLLSVWGERAPPPSLTAAISSRIAEASFMRTMWEALKLCLPITLMTFAVFTRSEMVITPGWTQILNTIAMLIGTCGFAFAMFGRYTRNSLTDGALRLLLTLLAGVVLFHPNDTFALSVSPLVLAGVVVGILRHRVVSPPAALPEGSDFEGEADPTGAAERVEEIKGEY